MESMDKPMIDYVRAQLIDRRGTWKRIADDLPSVSYNTIRRIATNESHSPYHKHVEALYEYFRERAA